MKKLFLALLFIMFTAGMASAAFLITDPMEGVVQYDVDVDGVIVENVAAESDGSLRFDVNALAVGAHIFKVKPEGIGGWPADWSAPLDATKPQTSTGLRIVE